jgi:hypothetical protein
MLLEYRGSFAFNITTSATTTAIVIISSSKIIRVGTFDSLCKKNIA